MPGEKVLRYSYLEPQRHTPGIAGTENPKMKKLLALAAAITVSLTGLAATNAQAQTPAAAAQAATQTPAQESPAKATGVDGKWHFVLDTEGGDRPVECEFTVDANGKVTGTFGKAAVAGTYFNKKLDLAFDFVSDEANETAQMVIKGVLDDTGKLTGNWQFSSYDGPFAATRTE